MFPCCSLVYEKYLDEEGKLNKDLYWKIVIELKRENPKLYKFTIDHDELSEEKICKCECHELNKEIMH